MLKRDIEDSNQTMSSECFRMNHKSDKILDPEIYHSCVSFFLLLWRKRGHDEESTA